MVSKVVRFDNFELDVEAGELRKHGRRIRLQDQPARLLVLLVTRAGELVTRSEIQKALWGDDEFVEFDHAINTAMRKIREVLNDDAEKPRLIETLPRKGYRFIAAVKNASKPSESPQEAVVEKPVENTPPPPPQAVPPQFALPRTPAWTLFVMIQIGYLSIYCAALYYMPNLDDALAAAGFVPVWLTFPAVLVTAMCGIAVRLYLLSAVGWQHPDGGVKFQRLFPCLVVLDALWAASPLLAARAIGVGIALAGVAGMAYLPFSQRTLIKSIYHL
jgi:DNA-binding winged helix-turn-helix (wHTH) protein